MWNYHQLVAEAMGEPDGVLMFDETGFVKKGKDSVGVARQYCGTLGQGGELSGGGVCRAMPRGMAMPWWTSACFCRRRGLPTRMPPDGQVQHPAELTFQSKPQLAAAMLQAIAQEGLLPFKYVVADCLYGNSPDFLDAVDACVGVTAFVAIPAETRCWLQRPRTEDKIYRYKGEVRSKRVVVAPDNAPCSVAAVAASLPASRWYRRTGLGRDQGADRVCVCSPTRDAL